MADRRIDGHIPAQLNRSIVEQVSEVVTSFSGRDQLSKN